MFDESWIAASRKGKNHELSRKTIRPISIIIIIASTTPIRIMYVIAITTDKN